MPCQCQTPHVFVRPSGTKVCLNDSCGLRIDAAPPKKERP
jgi:hypothetical protein